SELECSSTSVLELYSKFTQNAPHCQASPESAVPHPDGHGRKGHVAMSDILVERRGEVAWIRLNRPDRMNAYDAAMAQELTDAIRNASDSGVIVITGTGRAFCAGGYLANLRDPDPVALRGMFYASLHLYDAIRNSPRPVIAAVN